MIRLEFTEYPSWWNLPAAQLALDEALLEDAESNGQSEGWFRLWELPQWTVVLGRSSRLADEVNEERCRAAGLAIVRRCSGGATIVAGPGCLMYSVVLSYQAVPPARDLEQAHQYVLGQVAKAVNRCVSGAVRQGTSDLTWKGRKFSGNSLRCKRGHLLYHGTLLVDFPLAQISHYLSMPPRQPDYRQGRSHEDFLVCLPTTIAELRQALTDVWSASEHPPASTVTSLWPEATWRRLMRERYERETWHRLGVRS